MVGGPGVWPICRAFLSLSIRNKRVTLWSSLFIVVQITHNSMWIPRNWRTGWRKEADLLKEGRLGYRSPDASERGTHCDT